MKNMKTIIYLTLGYVLTAVAVVVMVNSNAGLSPWDEIGRASCREGV